MKAKHRADPSSTIREALCDVYVRSGRPADAACPEAPDAVLPAQSARNEAAIRLLTAWMADESGYDERAWPRVKKALQDNRPAYRKLFDE